MNIANAIGFLCLGAVMNALPFLGATPGGGLAADSSAMWLHFMGFVTGGLGSARLLKEAGREAMAAAARLAQRRAEARELAAQGARQTAPVGVRVTF